jgi:APA family basic amino acid/polyamine antiporter
VLGFVLIFSPSILVDNVHFGTAPTWGDFFLAIPVGMIAYTGIETISNLAEEARDPPRDIPRSIRLVALAVFAIYFTLPLIALSALPVKNVGGEFQTRLGLSPEEGGFANDPVLGLVKNLHLHGVVLDSLKIYVGLLAATILLIATNAGVIGASRITYAMATYRQLPEVFRRLHRRFKTPWLALVVFAGIASIAVILPGETTFLGTMYSFGAMLSFTIAHASVVALRVRRRDEELVYRARPNLRFRGVDWPLFALFGGLGTGIAWLVVVVQEPRTRWVGLGWLVVGFVAYAVYRRRVLRLPLSETSRAAALVLGLEVEYRTILVPVLRTAESEEALVAAARLASERRATIVILHVLEVPLDKPLDADLREQEETAYQILDEAQALLEGYAGVRIVSRLVRARSAGPAIVEEAARRDAEVIILGASRARVRGGKPIFGRTVDYVLRNSPTRVLVVAGKKAA